MDLFISKYLIFFSLWTNKKKEKFYICKDSIDTESVVFDDCEFLTCAIIKPSGSYVFIFYSVVQGITGKVVYFMGHSEKIVLDYIA